MSHPVGGLEGFAPNWDLSKHHSINRCLRVPSVSFESLKAGVFFFFFLCAETESRTVCFSPCCSCVPFGIWEAQAKCWWWCNKSYCPHLLGGVGVESAPGGSNIERAAKKFGLVLWIFWQVILDNVGSLNYFSKIIFWKEWPTVLANEICDAMPLMVFHWPVSGWEIAYMAMA